MATIRARRNPAGRPSAEGRAHRRDPVVRHAGDADRAHHLRRRRGGRRLHVHDRHRRLVGGRAAARSSRAAAHRPRCRREIEAIWKDLFFHTHATAVGAITSLALAAIDTALWDLRCRRAGQPLWKVAGGAQAAGARLHDRRRLAAPSRAAAGRRGASPRRRRDFRGAKVKVGKPSIAEDVARLAAVREAVGDEFEVMVDANQAFTVAEALPPRARVSSRSALALVRGAAAGGGPGRARRARRQGDDARSRSANRSITRRISASISSATPARSCRSTARASAASRRGSRSRISPRRSTSPVCPHFLMELHVSLIGRGAERRVGRVHSAAR